ncbi:MAG: zinc ribbon domain-containing protein [Huintestinicola sp.]
MFEKIVESISNTGKAVGEKAKIGTDIAKLNIKISTEERALTEIYQTVGETYYKNNKDNPCCDEMKKLFESVEEKLAAIDELKTLLHQTKGVVICPNCSAEIDAENDFCGKCGTKLEKPAPVVEEPVVLAEEAEAEEAGSAAEETTEE